MPRALLSTPASHPTLVVDDSESIRELVAAVVQGKGHRVLQAGTYADALQILCADRVRLCITDVWYPHHGTQEYGEHGLRLARDCAARGIPVLLISGDPVGGEIPWADGLAFLLKPFNLAQLRAALLQLEPRTAAVLPSPGHYSLEREQFFREGDRW